MKAPIVCGILNATPDSFFDGGKYSNLLEHGKRLIEAGADWIDIGGESTRPGAKIVPLQEELDRVCPLVEALSKEITVSIDTSKGDVAVEARKCGATILNDVRGFQDLDMQEASKSYPIAILMHSRGRPDTMQGLAKYDDVVSESIGWLLEQTESCHAKEIWLDPGIGFAKSFEQNIEIMQRLNEYAQLPFPILLGTSRKSFIGTLLNQPNAHERLIGSLATVADGFSKGIQAFRVHDVHETKMLLTMLEKIHNPMR